MNKPRFKQHFHVAILPPDTVALVTETGYQLLHGRHYVHLAPLLTGEYTVPALIGLLASAVPPPLLFGSLKQLEARGLIVEQEDLLPLPATAFWHSMGATAALAADRLQQRVVLTAVGAASIQSLIPPLQSLGITVDTTGSLDVVVTDDYLQPELQTINSRNLANGRPWLLVKLTGSILWLGPLFVPGQTGCWTCLAERIGGNRQVESFILRRNGRSAPLPTSRVILDSAVQMGANLAATEIAKWLVQGNRQLQGHLLTFDTLTSDLQKHALTRRPQCGACGDGRLPHAAWGHPNRLPEPIILRSQKKKFIQDGGYRTCFPAETLARYQHHISPITGVVSSLVNLIGEQSAGLAYSYTAGHNFAMSADDINILRQNLRGRSSGKGMSEIQAKVSALGEAIERYSGVYRGDNEISFKSSYRDLGEQAIHLHDCLHFSWQQYQDRLAWNRQQKTLYHLVPHPLDENAQIHWTPLWSLTQQTVKYVPTTYCYYGHPEMSLFFCGSDANGCAAGNTLEEAILQGFLELVERDSVAIWWYNRVKRPLVDIHSFGISDYYNRLEAYYHQLHREIWVLDITADLQVPTFAAISRRTDRPVEDIIIGFGAHLDAKVALLRAITEMNQFLFPVLSTAPDGSTFYRTDEPDVLTWFKEATAENQPYLLPDASLSVKTLADYPPLSGDDLLDDVQTCISLARAAGMDMLVLDQTRPDIGMPVCRVIMPGMRHFWRRLGPGRLYDVPVKLGWLEQPTPEEAMNPVSMFF